MNFKTLRFSNQSGTGEELFKLAAPELAGDIIDYTNKTVEVAPSINVDLYEYTSRLFTDVEVVRIVNAVDFIVIFVRANKDKTYVKQRNHEQAREMFRS